MMTEQPTKQADTDFDGFEILDSCEDQSWIQDNTSRSPLSHNVHSRNNGKHKFYSAIKSNPKQHYDTTKFDRFPRQRKQQQQQHDTANTDRYEQ